MRELPTITHVPPSPGAAYVVQCEDWLPDFAKQQLVDRLVRTFGATPDRVFILDGGRTLSVIGLEDQRRVPDLLDANNRLHHRNVNLTCAVMRAQGVFIEYAQLHEAKGTEEGAEKARANRAHARYLDDFVQAFGADNAKASPQWLAIRAEVLKAALVDLLDASLKDYGSPDGEDDAEAVAHGQSVAGGPIEPSAVTFGHLRRAQGAVAAYWTQPESEAFVIDKGDGYRGAFYTLAAMMDVAASPDSPATVWRDQMLPRLRAVFRPGDMGVPLKEAGPVVAGGKSLVSAFLHQWEPPIAPNDESGVRKDAEALLAEFTAFAADQLKARTGSCSVAVVAEPGKGGGLRLVDDGRQE